ncbi:MAG: hypothetical protein COX17_06320 [Deltaproteobacteria bacterium CG23_combo_of_CG06-09_8_20_14_all_60_8]|nr:MAG: hypothetical protein AUK28_00265 [Desulfobacterales bacterium CG2_30_60_27]PIP43550.1 MAG: hypothetical protein COX17_06320 [Deltaproteobacteria bacterium CG23_combo_of_CG06-09_8_20_14_all_60_8]
MNRRPLHYIIYMLLALLAGFATAPTPAAADALASTEWLTKNLSAKGLVILDVRTADNYGVGHIPGAVNLPYDSWDPKNDETGCHLVPTAEVITDYFQKLGINNDSHVIIYDHGNTVSDASQGASAYWIMNAMGHKNISYLDGGFTKWTFEGRTIDNKKPTPQPGNFIAKLDSSKLTTLQDISASLKKGGTTFLDVRNSDQHFGFAKSGEVKRFGHIPGSLTWPADYMTNAGINRAPAVIKSKEDLTTMAKGVGLPTDKNTRIIVYCNSSQFAGMGFFVLHERLGYKNVSVFDGSMIEYAANENLPIAVYSWGFITK